MVVQMIETYSHPTEGQFVEGRTYGLPTPIAEELVAGGYAAEVGSKTKAAKPKGKAKADNPKAEAKPK